MGTFKNLQGWIAKENGFPDSMLRVPEDAQYMRKNNHTYWEAECECGTRRFILASEIVRGQKSCGCLQKKRAEEAAVNMTGWIMKNHGIPNSKITVIDKAYSKNGSVYWNCKCECGTEKIIDGHTLRAGAVISCGCSRKETNAIDLTGWVMKNHGVPDSKLTVLKYDEEHTYDRHKYWLCQCECGRIKSIRGDSIRSGRIKTCGECMYAIPEGTVFGSLTVLKQIESKNQKRMFLCSCICGRIIEVSGQDLRNNRMRSCGCGFKSKNDILTGKRINFFTVGKYLGTAGNGEGALYECICDCGNTFTSRATALRYDPPVSCGCKTATKGELAIKRILEANNINYIYNKQFFKDLIGSNNGILRYDFVILNENNQPKFLVEYDGEQHFRPIDHFGGEKEFEKRKKDDEIKNNYAFNHNISLVRIPYTEKNITLETIMGDQYLVRPPQESENEN